MGDPVEIKITATGAATSAQAIEQPAQALRKVEEAATKATTAVERTAAATKTVGSGSVGLENATRSLRAMDAAAERAASALARTQAATRSVLGSAALPSSAGAEGNPVAGKLGWDDAVARWSAAARTGSTAADGLRRSAGDAAQGMRAMSSAAGSGTEKMQALAGAAMTMAGATGPAATGVRTLAGAMMMSNGNAAQFISILKGGAAMAGVAYGLDTLISKWQGLAVAVDEANAALAAAGSTDAGTVTRGDLIRERLGGASRQQAAINATPEESEAARREFIRNRVTRLREELRPRTPEERALDSLETEDTGKWNPETWSMEKGTRKPLDTAYYQTRVKQEQEKDAKAAAEKSRLESIESAKRSIGDRIWKAQESGVEDKNATKLARMGVPVWEKAGGGDAQFGVEILEAQMQAEEKAAKDAEDKRKEAAEKAAAARKELGKLDLDAIRQTALDKAQAIEDAAEKEAAALDRAADKLATRAKDAKTKADAAWENLLGGKHADGKTDADDAADRRKAADSKRLERRAKTVIARMEEGQDVTAEGKEIAAAYVERERAKWLAGGAKGAREGADAAAKRRDVAGKTGPGMQRGFAAADQAAERAALVAEIMGVPAPEPQGRQVPVPRGAIPAPVWPGIQAAIAPAIASMPAAGIAGGAVVAELKTSNRLLALIAKSGGVE